MPTKGYFIEEDQESRSSRVYIKLPRMKTSLKEVLDDARKENRPIPEAEIVNYLYDIVQALRYLQERGIAHRNIKPNKIFIDNDGNVRLAGFSLAALKGDDTTVYGHAGTPNYMAPEIGIERSDRKLLKISDLFNADLWSLGVTFLEVCNLSIPKFNSRDVETTVNEMLRESEKHYTEPLISLIRGLLKSDPSERISLESLAKELKKRYRDVIV